MVLSTSTDLSLMESFLLFIYSLIFNFYFLLMKDMTRFRDLNLLVRGAAPISFLSTKMYFLHLNMFPTLPFEGPF